MEQKMDNPKHKQHNIFYEKTPHLIESCHQVLHSVTLLSTLGRYGGHWERGLEVWVAFGLTLGTAEVSSKETEVVQGKNLHTGIDIFLLRNPH